MKKRNNDIFTFSVILIEIENQISYNLKALSPLQNRDGEASQTLLGTIHTCSHLSLTALIIAGIIPISQVWKLRLKLAR